MWSELESYRQLEQEYEHARAEYQRAEADYRDHLERKPDDPSLVSQYEQLEKMRADVDALYGRLSALRQRLAAMRDKKMTGFGA